MASNAKSRKLARDYLAVLLNAALVVADEQAKAVYNYQKGVLRNSPEVMVVSAGSKRRKIGAGNAKYISDARLAVKNHVRDADADLSWTELDVEDTLDLLEKAVSDVVMDNRSEAQNANVPWANLYLESQDGPFSSIVHVTDEGGNSYYRETILVIAEMHDD